MTMMMIDVDDTTDKQTSESLANMLSITGGIEEVLSKNSSLSSYHEIEQEDDPFEQENVVVAAAAAAADNDDDEYNFVPDDTNVYDNDDDDDNYGNVLEHSISDDDDDDDDEEEDYDEFFLLDNPPSPYNTTTTTAPTSSTMTTNAVLPIIPVDPVAVEAELAKELNALSLQQRDSALYDIHGVANIIQETPQLLQTSLEKLERCIQKQKQKMKHNIAIRRRIHAYLRAEQQNPQYVQQTSLRLAFLRAKSFQVKTAWKAMMYHFTIKQELFGNTKLLAQDITQDDLSPEDMACLTNGHFQLLPVCDPAGRYVIVISISHAKFDKALTLARVTWYSIMSIVGMANGEALGKGVIGIICSKVGAGRNKHITANVGFTMQKVRRSIPIRITSLHFCSETIPPPSSSLLSSRQQQQQQQQQQESTANDNNNNNTANTTTNTAIPSNNNNNKKQKGRRRQRKKSSSSSTRNNSEHSTTTSSSSSSFSITDWIMSFCLESALRIRTRFHRGSHIENLKSLDRFGIPSDVFPIAQDGNLRRDRHRGWIASMKALEQEKKKQDKITTTTTAIQDSSQQQQDGENYNHLAATKKVLAPSQSDVLLGRGRASQTHIGNLRLRLMLESNMAQFESLLERGEKLQFSMDMVHIVKNSGGHFLKLEPNGGLWVSVSDQEACKKVAHDFRTLRTKQCTTRVGDSTTAATTGAAVTNNKNSDGLEFGGTDVTTMYTAAIGRTAGGGGGGVDGANKRKKSKQV